MELEFSLKVKSGTKTKNFCAVVLFYEPIWLLSDITQQSQLLTYIALNVAH